MREGVGVMPSFVKSGHFTRIVFFALLGRDFSCFVGLAPTMLIRRFGGLHPLPNDLPECWYEEKISSSSMAETRTMSVVIIRCIPTQEG